MRSGATTTRSRPTWQGKVWLACTNYFRHPSGKVVTQLPYSGRKFFERTRRMVAGDYIMR